MSAAEAQQGVAGAQQAMAPARRRREKLDPVEQQPDPVGEHAGSPLPRPPPPPAAARPPAARRPPRARRPRAAASSAPPPSSAFRRRQGWRDRHGVGERPGRRRKAARGARSRVPALAAGGQLLAASHPRPVGMGDHRQGQHRGRTGRCQRGAFDRAGVEPPAVAVALFCPPFTLRRPAPTVGADGSDGTGRQYLRTPKGGPTPGFHPGGRPKLASHCFTAASLRRDRHMPAISALPPAPALSRRDRRSPACSACSPRRGRRRRRACSTPVISAAPAANSASATNTVSMTHDTAGNIILAGPPPRPTSRHARRLADGQCRRQRRLRAQAFAGRHPVLAFTYLGGALDDVVTDVAVDGSGRIVVTGATKSSNFPTVAALPGEPQRRAGHLRHPHRERRLEHPLFDLPRRLARRKRARQPGGDRPGRRHRDRHPPPAPAISRSPPASCSRPSPAARSTPRSPKSPRTAPRWSFRPTSAARPTTCSTRIAVDASATSSSCCAPTPPASSRRRRGPENLRRPAPTLTWSSSTTAGATASTPPTSAASSLENDYAGSLAYFPKDGSMVIFGRTFSAELSHHRQRRPDRARSADDLFLTKLRAQRRASNFRPTSAPRAAIPWPSAGSDRRQRAPADRPARPSPARSAASSAVSQAPTCRAASGSTPWATSSFPASASTACPSCENPCPRPSWARTDVIARFSVSGRAAIRHHLRRPPVRPQPAGRSGGAGKRRCFPRRRHLLGRLAVGGYAAARRQLRRRR